MDLVERWGEQSVVRADSNDLRAVPIPDTTRQFLVDVGMPRRIWHIFTVDPDPEDDPRSVGERHFLATRGSALGPVVRIGSDYGSDICVNGSGEVWSIDPTEASGSTRFVNAGICEFVTSLYELSGFRGALYGLREDNLEEAVATPTPLRRHLSDADIDAEVTRLSDRLSSIDPRAWADEQHWWPTVMSQV